MSSNSLNHNDIQKVLSDEYHKGIRHILKSKLIKGTPQDPGGGYPKKRPGGLIGGVDPPKGTKKRKRSENHFSLFGLMHFRGK